jgi:hypothetical protein
MGWGTIKELSYEERDEIGAINGKLKQLQEN